MEKKTEMDIKKRAGEVVECASLCRETGTEVRVNDSSRVDPGVDVLFSSNVFSSPLVQLSFLKDFVFSDSPAPADLTLNPTHNALFNTLDLLATLERIEIFLLFSTSLSASCRQIISKIPWHCAKLSTSCKESDCTTKCPHHPSLPELNTNQTVLNDFETSRRRESVDL